MTVLIIDTSTERGIVALGTLDGKIISEKRLPAGYQNSDHLFSVMEELGVAEKTLKLIICATGPGSFTGIRVGAVVAKTLSFACKIPLVGVCTLEAFQAPALIDAKMGGAYILRASKWVRCELAAALQDLSACEVYTPNAGLLRGKAPQIQWVECYPSAELYLKCGLAKLEQASVTGQLVIEY